MGDTINFDYYYGIEAEQFSFYRVPRLLIKDERFKGLSSDAKLLYGLMLDRMSLSMKNGWLDDESRAYIIYTVDAIMEDLGCAKATCIKIMKELDTENGIGLIEKKRRGLGKPDIIYVKNFSTITDAKTEEKCAPPQAFQSTPSAWRETGFRCAGSHCYRLFQSTPSAWRETSATTYGVTFASAFQSTPSAWRETMVSRSLSPGTLDFNPLPPHGGRLNSVRT